MKYILIFLLSISFLHGKSKDSCYSVQLSSFIPNKSKVYNFELQNYPKNCQLIEFTNINAIRCGCFQNYNRVKKELKTLRKSYTSSMIVTTYKYRFKTLVKKELKEEKPQVKTEKKPKVKIVTPIIEKVIEPKEEQLHLR